MLNKMAGSSDLSPKTGLMKVLQARKSLKIVEMALRLSPDG